MRQNVFAAGLWGSGIRMELWKGLVRNGGEEKDGDGKREGKGNWNWGLFVSLDLGGQTPLSVCLSAPVSPFSLLTTFPWKRWRHRLQLPSGILLYARWCRWSEQICLKLPFLVKWEFVCSRKCRRRTYWLDLFENVADERVFLGHWPVFI